jgi:ankyrin repeat protein
LKLFKLCLDFLAVRLLSQARYPVQLTQWAAQGHTRAIYQRSDSEQLEVNAKLFIVICKKNMSTQEKVKKIKKLLGKKPQPDINAQDGNDNWNTALHLAIEGNELGVVNFLLTQGADTAIANGDGENLFTCG